MTRNNTNEYCLRAKWQGKSDGLRIASFDCNPTKFSVICQEYNIETVSCAGKQPRKRQIFGSKEPKNPEGASEQEEPKEEYGPTGQNEQSGPYGVNGPNGQGGSGPIGSKNPSESSGPSGTTASYGPYGPNGQYGSGGGPKNENPFTKRNSLDLLLDPDLKDENEREINLLKARYKKLFEKVSNRKVSIEFYLVHERP